MQVEKYLEKYQPIIYKTFVNSLQQDKLSHAFLLSGGPGTPLLEIAKFLAKSILCDDPSPLACNACITCMRVDDNNYPDYFLFDGSKKTIGKESVIEIENAFDKKAFEEKGVRIYILHLVENMTTEAINTILKFLEEPGLKVYAFLTTNNDSAILPTIVSRCQMMKVKLINRNHVIDEAVSFGIDPKDAELMSYFYNSGELIYDILNAKEVSKEDKNVSEEDIRKYEEKKNYNLVKEWFEGLLDVLISKNTAKVAYFIERNINPKIKTKESMRLFIDILSECFEDLVNIQNHNAIYLKSYATILKEIAAYLPHIDQTLIELLKCRSLINGNVNTSLLCDHIMNFLTKEE